MRESLQVIRKIFFLGESVVRYIAGRFKRYSNSLAAMATVALATGAVEPENPENPRVKVSASENIGDRVRRARYNLLLWRKGRTQHGCDIKKAEV